MNGPISGALAFLFYEGFISYGDILVLSSAGMFVSAAVSFGRGMMFAIGAMRRAKLKPNAGENLEGVPSRAQPAQETQPARGATLRRRAVKAFGFSLASLAGGILTGMLAAYLGILPNM